MLLNGLSVVNVELTDFCNKKCKICGRRGREKQFPEIKKTYGEIDFELLKKISKQLPKNIIVQYHWNGESLLYKKFGDAIRLFPNQIKNIVTNGKLLLKKFDEIVDNLDTIAISVFEGDPEAEEQFLIVKEFLVRKGNKKPFIIIRQNGDVDVDRYKQLGLLVASRAIHAPEGSFNYVHKQPVVPEHGICLDILSHLAINKEGEVSICVRFDPNRLGVLGNVKNNTLSELWNSPKRLEWLRYHIQGQRDKVPLCSKCEFYGLPTG